MLYQAIREAREKYHSGYYGWDYDCAVKAHSQAVKKRHNSSDPNNPSYEEAAILLSFANGWGSRMQRTADDVRSALREIQPDLDTLKNDTILDVCLNKDKRELICRSFKVLAGCNRKGHNEATGASKMLHIINPKLFIMWDGAIRTGYICKLQGKLEKKGWIWYTEFLQEMRCLAKQAVCEAMEKEKNHSCETAIASLTGGERTFAKALDEYNFMKYTKEAGSVWRAEYESCNSP